MLYCINEAEIVKYPTAATGKFNPEALEYDLTGWFSREITRKDRSVYRPDPLDANVIEVHQCKGHYCDT
ncbi:MAG: type II toxin-antitoxin system YoeB family toxin [Coriobacteriales bacterium]|jgi:Txe/YoeB family toxin of Txe-Axe toxin-antitoxin module|nr:type II toxin-antitoxin system YoeB family toxin [Coriobacteriales bacterium]